MESCDRWAFTSWKRPEVNLKLTKYIVWQREFCSKTGLEHYQGYIEFIKVYKLFQVKSLFKDKTIHIEPARKCRLANYAYCTKNQSFAGERYEFGNCNTGLNDPDWDSVLVMDRS